MHSESKNKLIKLSKVISNIFNPTFSIITYYIYLCLVKFNIKETIEILTPLLLLTIFPIMIWIGYNVKKGNYTNMDVSDRKQRVTLYYFIFGAIGVYLLFNYFYNHVADYQIFYLLLLLILLFLSNFFIKSSMHTALNIYVAALFYNLNPQMGLIWLGISFLVGITRIIIKRHTVQEVISGTFLAFVVSILYLYTSN